MTQNQLYQKIIRDYGRGISPAQLCRTYDLTEHTFYGILKKFPLKTKAAKAKALLVRKQKHKSGQLNQTVIPKPEEKYPKISDAEKIAHLEKMLENEKKKNRELETLLEVAKDHLGKF
jgi:hypothetical protein